MDDIEAEKAQAKKGPDCAFIGIYKALHKPDADDLRDALARPEISSAVSPAVSPSGACSTGNGCRAS